MKSNQAELKHLKKVFTANGHLKHLMHGTHPQTHPARNQPTQHELGVI